MWNDYSAARSEGRCVVLAPQFQQAYGAGEARGYLLPTAGHQNVREKLLKEGIDRVPDQQAVDEEIARLRSTPAPTMEPPEPDGLPDPAMWTHLLSFNTTSQRGFYKIQPYRATPQFPDWQRCYGQRELSKNRHFYTQEFANLPFPELEMHIRKFAHEAEQIRQRKVQNPN